MDNSTITLTRSPYEVLKTDRWADFETIKAHYYKLVKQYNPEYYPEEFIEIRTAFDILHDPNRRAMQDIEEFAPPPHYKSKDFPDLEEHAISMFKLNQEWKSLFGDRALEQLGDHERDRALHLLRGMALHHAMHDRLEEADEIWAEILKNDPDDNETRRNQLYGMWRKAYNTAINDNFSEAETLFCELIDKGAQHGAIHQNIALAREKQGKKEESYEAWRHALELYKQDLKKDPNSTYRKAIVISLHKYTGGRFLESKGEDQEADSVTAGSSKELGYACIRQGNWRQAQEALEQALRENSHDIDVICQLGWAYLNTNQHNRAFNQWNHALKLAPGKQSVVDHLVRGHAIFGKRLKDQRIYNQALVQYKNALKFEPDNVELRLQLADTYFQMQNYTSALREYQRILEMDPRNKVARQGIRESKRLGGLR